MTARCKLFVFALFCSHGLGKMQAVQETKRVRRYSGQSQDRPMGRELVVDKPITSFRSFKAMVAVTLAFALVVVGGGR